MKHLRAQQKKGKRAACSAKLTADDTLVDAALEAECDPCRVAVNVAKKGDKTWERDAPIGVHETPKWKETPMENAEAILFGVLLRKNS